MTGAQSHQFLSLSADYVFDFTTLLRGYTSDRKWNVGIAAGPVLGYELTTTAKNFGAQLSVPVTYKLNDRFGILFEPRGRAFVGDYLLHRTMDWNGNIAPLHVSAQLGMKYTIDKNSFEDYVSEVKKDFDSYKKKAKKVDNRFFTDFGLGMQQKLGSDFSAGPRATASLGYWLNSDFALRGSLLFSSYNWQDGDYFGTAYDQYSAGGAARLDVVVNPLNFFMGRSFRQFDINALVGFEMGGDFRFRANTIGMLQKLKPSYGPSVGLQLLYNESSSHALYLEPRYIHSVSGGEKDNLWALTGGMYFTSSDYALRSKARQPERFVPEFSVALSGGLDMPIRPTVYDGTSVAGFTPGITGELRVGPYSGLRMSLNHTSLRNNSPVEGTYDGRMTGAQSHQFLSLSADYVFDFTTLLRGYTSDRKWNVGIAAGPVLGYELTTTAKNFGAQLSVPVTYKLNDRFGILFEPRGRAFVGDYLLHRTMDWNGNIAPLHMSAQLGLKYTIDNDNYKQETKQPERFVPTLSVALSGGMDVSLRPSASTGPFIADLATGITGEFRFGPFSGLRMSLNHNTYSNRIAGIDCQASYLSFAPDYLFDLTTLLRGYTADRKWTVGIAAGPVISSYLTSSPIIEGYKPKKTDVGAQLSVPVTYNINERFGIMFEPRGRVFVKEMDFNGSISPLQAGAQLGLKYTLGNKIRVKSQEEDKTRDFVNLAMGMQLLRDAGVDFGQTGGLQVGAGIGRWVTPAWGVRLSGEFAASNKDYNENDHSMLRSVRLGGRMDMMLNPFALNRGYKPTRWEAALLAGFECGLGALAGDYRTYNSLSAGAQLRYNTNEKNVLYVEPRYSLGEDQFSVTAGLEFSMTEHRFRSSKKQVEEFKPYFSMGLSGGFSHNSFSRMTYKSSITGCWGLSGEYHFTPYSGARLTYSGDLSGVGVDYMFDISTLFAGYTADRRLDVALAAGPVVGKQVKGGQLGVPVQFHLNENWGISLEPRARMFLSNSLGLPRMDMNLQMGVKYTF